MRRVLNLKLSIFFFASRQVRDLMSWAAGLRAAMLTEEKVRDAASAQILKAEHEALKAEIEAREASFRQVMELGEAMVQGGHYANEVRSEQLRNLKDWENLGSSHSEQKLVREKKYPSEVI